MKLQDIEKRRRPRLLFLLVCSLLLVLVSLGMIWGKNSKSAPAANDAPEPVVAEPTPTVPPVAVAEPPPPQPSVPPGPAPVPAPPTPLEQQWGLQISSVTLALQGAGVELSYKIVEPAKTALLADGHIPAYLIDQGSGTKILINVPPPATPSSPHSRARSTVAMSRRPGAFPPPQNKMVAGQTYTTLLPNGDGTVKTGSRVAVVIGDYQADHLTVR